MDICNTSCCAVSELNGLDQFLNEPKEAMLDFIKRLTREDYYDPWREDYYDPRSGRYSNARPANIETCLAAHYIFTGVERSDYVRPDYLEDDEEDEGEVNVGYANQFYNFIRENKLGRVVRSAGEYNRINHPDHWVRVYVWTPDVKALATWYKKNKKAR